MRTGTITARSDASLHASVDQLEPLRYADGGSVVEDRPGHVRAASAIRRWGSRLVIVQDDVNALAAHHQPGETRAMLLPAGPGGRRVFDDLIGNKQGKLDLEACVGLDDGRLVAFGSGSSRMRESLVLIAEGREPRVVAAPLLYQELRANTSFAGSELNVEGALVLGDDLLLFQRGNGAPRGPIGPVNAIGAIDVGAFLRWLDDSGPTPRLRSVAQVELGELGGSKLGFTDAAVTGDGRIAVLAAAEASPDALSDGPVTGCQLGLLEGETLRMTDILDERGERLVLKLEGIEPRAGAALVFDVVADMDAPSEAARLGRLVVREG